jgi:hypothetical protein
MGTSNTPRERTVLQSIAIEYRTTGAMDGQTLAPFISLDPDSPHYIEKDPADGVYRYPGVLTQNIGLIDVSMAGLPTNGGAIGDRYIKGIFLGAGVFIPGPAIFVADTIFVEDGFPVEMVQVVVGSPIGPLPFIYHPNCFTIPQGCYLGVQGIPAGGGLIDINIVRVQIWQAENATVWSSPLLEQACCCEQEDRGPPPPPDGG